MTMHALNFKALQQIRYLGLSDKAVQTKEWALRLMINTLYDSSST